MFRKNTDGQHCGFCLINSSTGAALIGASVTVKRSIDGGAQATATGTVTELGGGQYDYAPSADDVNGDETSLLFTASNAVPVEKTIIMTAADPTDPTYFGITALQTISTIVNTILSIIRNLTGLGSSSSSSGAEPSLWRIPLTPTITGKTTAKSGVTLTARILGNGGVPITRASLSTIAYNVYNLTDATNVGSGTLTVASVVYDDLQTSDPSWTKDSEDNPGPDGRWGYNFRSTLAASLFAVGDVRYQVDVTFTPASGEPFVQTFQFQPRNVYA